MHIGVGSGNRARGVLAAGALSGGRVDRATALGAALAGAFGPFATELYGEDG